VKDGDERLPLRQGVVRLRVRRGARRRRRRRLLRRQCCGFCGKLGEEPVPVDIALASLQQPNLRREFSFAPTSWVDALTRSFVMVSFVPSRPHNARSIVSSSTCSRPPSGRDQRKLRAAETFKGGSVSRRARITRPRIFPCSWLAEPEDGVTLSMRLVASEGLTSAGLYVCALRFSTASLALLLAHVRGVGAKPLQGSRCLLDKGQHLFDAALGPRCNLRAFVFQIVQFSARSASLHLVLEQLCQFE
jgi:hypothetical protein